MTTRPRIHRLLDRLFPHDTLNVGGRPYMHRWYVFGYAPTEDDPDARMICAGKMAGTDGQAPCLMELQPGCSAADGTGEWSHLAETFDLDHAPVPVSAPREGWRWQDHGIGAFRIHCTVASDDSRAFHDHPWPFFSIGIRGAYLERRPKRFPSPPQHLTGDDRTVWYPTPSDAVNTTTHRYRAPFVNRKAATDLHVLEVERGPVWTLFCTRPKQRSWGFAGPFGWLPWRRFDAEFPERDAYTS